QAGLITESCVADFPLRIKSTAFFSFERNAVDFFAKKFLLHKVRYFAQKEKKLKRRKEKDAEFDMLFTGGGGRHKTV
ncbi:MAG: hypothetical protein IKC05_03860, partial [Lentisphaeria bacterium]|nr:hypothetical protein [Lentisphaeria bacterium]